MISLYSIPQLALLGIALICYGASTLWVLLTVCRNQSPSLESRVYPLLFWGGLAANTGFLLWIILEGGGERVPNQFETITAFAAGIAMMTLFLSYYSESPLTFSVGGLLNVGLLIYGGFMLAISPEPALELSYSAWVSTHVTLIIGSYVLFSMGFISGLLFLLQDRLIRNHQRGPMLSMLPSLERSEFLAGSSVYLGFPLLTVGIFVGILGGEYLMENEFPDPWWYDTTIFITLFTWLVYGILLVLRRTVPVKGWRFALLCVIGFCLILFSVTAGEFLGSGIHGFSQGV